MGLSCVFACMKKQITHTKKKPTKGVWNESYSCWIDVITPILNTNEQCIINYECDDGRMIRIEENNHTFNLIYSNPTLYRQISDKTAEQFCIICVRFFCFGV